MYILSLTKNNNNNHNNNKNIMAMYYVLDSFEFLFLHVNKLHWYPGSGVALDCIDSWSLHPYLLSFSHNV